MRVLIAVPFFPPKWIAGTEIATYNIAQNLAKRGHDVHVVTSLDDGLEKENKENGFCVHRVYWRRIKYLGIITLWIKMFFILARIRPDIVHVQSTLTGFSAYFGKKIFNIPYIVYGRGSDIYSESLFTKSISKFIIKNSDSIIALTENMKDEIKKYDKCRYDIHVIPNGVNVTNFRKADTKIESNKKEKNESENYIIFVGRLHPIKGVNYLIDAMRNITEECPKTHLIIIGSGPSKSELENNVEKLHLHDCVSFIGNVPNNKIPEYMNMSDILVLPSLSEGFPNVLLEAMASGLPIVTTNVKGIPDIINNGVNGIIIEPKSSKEISESVISLIKNKELRDKISINNKNKALSYSWEIIAERIETIYRSCLENNI